MVQLTDNSPAVKKAIEAAVTAFLHEAGVELVKQTADNSRPYVDTGQTWNSYAYKVVDEPDGQKCIVSSDYMNAVWEEFGTGEYALEGGKKGGWWIKVGNGSGEISPDKVKEYGWSDYRYAKDGSISFVFTYGKKPRKPLQRAYEKLRDPLKDQLVKQFGATFNG